MKKQRENFYRYFKLLRNVLCAFQIYACVSFQNTKELGHISVFSVESDRSSEDDRTNTKETVKMLFGMKDLDIDKDVVKRAVTIIKGK